VSAAAQPLTIVVDSGERVSGLLQAPMSARACYVMAHGAGAGMTHPFMASLANDLATRGVATLRFQFPYMERGSKRTDPPKLAQATVRAAVAEAAKRLESTGWKDVYAYFMHEPTAPAYAQALMRHAGR